MRIKLHDHYQNAGGVRLKPGEYDSTDERLQGLADYLVKTEHASIVPELSPEPSSSDEVPPNDEVPPDGDEADEAEGDDGDRDEDDADDTGDEASDDADYQAMTKGQLLNIATAGGLELSSHLTKQAMIDALIAHGKK